MNTQPGASPAIRTFQPENFPDWEQLKKNTNPRKDDREIMGVDDKLIGDDLELEHAQMDESVDNEQEEGENVY